MAARFMRWQLQGVEIAKAASNDDRSPPSNQPDIGEGDAELWRILHGAVVRQPAQLEFLRAVDVGDRGHLVADAGGAGKTVDEQLVRVRTRAVDGEGRVVLRVDGDVMQCFARARKTGRDGRGDFHVQEHDRTFVVDAKVFDLHFSRCSLSRTCILHAFRMSPETTVSELAG